MTTEFGAVMQHGYIVEDVEATARAWAERMNVGPFYVLDHVALDEYAYRGQAMAAEMKLAFGYWGPIQVELVQPLGAGRTFYDDALRNGAGRLNHFATVVEDLDGLMARRGLADRVVQAGRMSTGVSFVYLEDQLPGGLVLELIQASPQSLMGFQAMEAAARAWDGRNPVRPMAALAEDMAELKR